MDIIHKFEQAGLGKAPFVFMGVEEKRYQACQGAPIQPGGCCDYCGEAIVECCIIRSVDGKIFTVGNVCVLKTDDAGLINVTKRAVNKARREKQVIRENQRIAAAKELIARHDVRSKLSAEPHPYDYQAAKGLTRLSWALWMMSNAGNKGKMDVVKYLERI